jgi:hypothetical protein
VIFFQDLVRLCQADHAGPPHELSCSRFFDLPTLAASCWFLALIGAEHSEWHTALGHLCHENNCLDADFGGGKEGLARTTNFAMTTREREDGHGHDEQEWGKVS